MADAGTWEKIQQGVRETERLLSRKQNNLAMVKARQTLEYMVKALAERACIVEGDMADIIDQLYEGRWIDKTTRDRYHKIRIIGNKAVHDGNDNPSEANLACQLLSAEYLAFAPRNRKPQNRPGAAPPPTPRQRPDGPNRRRARRKRSPLKDFMRIFIPIIGILLLIILIRILLPKTAENPDPTAPQTTTNADVAPSDPTDTQPMLPSEETPEESTQEQPVETTSAPETTAAPRIYKTTETLNVRAQPSTTARILVQLAPDTEVNVMGTYDEQWTIINYDGQDAYVATAYLTQ